MLLRLVHVSKIYSLGDQQINALDDLSLDIDAGEYVSIMGPSGSGKSTLLHIMSMLDVPTVGEVWLKDKQVQKYNETQLAGLRNREIGFVFQQFNLLPKVSALENVALPLLYGNVSAAERERRAREELERVGLGDRIHNTRSQLSGGQQQRVAIARALVTKPAIIFADEPTGNLDSKSSDEIIELFGKLHKDEGATIVLVTHEQEIAQHAKRQIIVRDGKILSDSKHKKIK
ncbi:MAG TPA: ABC transporter ATP-binding protein [Patescibacteria group bacterium]|nr:ABC transporter ATP-binding protein [Patescibacteria group bacterium]